MQGVEQVRRGVARATPGVGAAAMREVLLHRARVRRPVLADEREHVGRTLCRRRVPARLGIARMHQGEVPARKEAVVDEAVLLDGEARIAPLQIAGAIALDAMAQGQVLRASRGADRIGLDEAELVDRPAERGRREERTGHGIAAQVVESRSAGHAE